MDDLRRRAGDSFLAEDLDVRVPRIEMFGDRRVLIEHHGGILEYGPDVMRVKCGALTVVIRGEGLELARLRLHDLAVRGKITGIELF